MYVYKYLYIKFQGKRMGTSLASGKEQILSWFQQNEKDIKCVIDIGAGSGTYVKLIKENAGCCVDAEWIGIEAWLPYIQEFNLSNRYNRILNTDVRTLDWNTLTPSVVIAGDILEHMTKIDAITLVNQVLASTNTMIISIPIRHMPQDAINGNPFEVHVKDDWSHEEVMDTWAHYITHYYRKSVKSKIGVYWLERQL